MGKLILLVWICTMLANFACGFQRGDVRLVNGDNDYEGRVEIFLNGEWGTIDDDPWDNDDAGVVCRQLGYTFGGVAYGSAHFGQGTGPIWLDNIGCTGNEDNLLSCSHQNDTSEDSHSEDVGVACNGNVVRLVGGNGSDEGRVEIFMNGQWGTVDDDPWNDIDAGVVCRQLGYLHGGAAFRVGHFGEGTGPIWLDDINCVGNEPHLMKCAHGTDTSEDNHSEDVGVRCAWKVRLVEGSLPSEGRVEVLINNRWGTIKDDNWDNREANVVCFQLGYASGGIAYSGSYFGEGEGPVLLENFKCAGTESSLFSCAHREISLDGGHSQDAGVACFDLSKDFCSSQPCAHNGKCVIARTSFVCLCPTGFNGTRCENVVDPCDSNPCEHNGLCIREQNIYRCICPDGVEGTRCEIDSGPCNSRDCKVSNNCVQRLNYRYCTCPGTSNGTILCQYEINACFNNPCTDNETCLAQGNTFDCVPKGKLNSINFETNACYSNPCKEKETCLSRGNSFDCVTAEKITSSRSEPVSSYISLILAVCAVLAAIVCLVKIHKMQGALTQQESPSVPVFDDDHVQINFLQTQNSQEEDRAIGYNKL
ncbi:Neurotrypsin [Holothuria leucospilota]|uniref:Neurotrypsin n=1 Tax=Holothuria leucospilota TaxID=206669 RepID=A0A9Q1BZ69_HOLLE|nr:Neurotrypsin [Holothuria leucospilota]